MKRYFLIAPLITLSILLASCKKDKVQLEYPHVYGEAVDVDNNKYITVDINGEMWFTENLSCKSFRNGDPIIEARTDNEWEYALNNGIPAWCYSNNDSTLSETYGIMYNYHAIKDSRGLAPEGWHISSSDDWQKLINNYGGEWNAGYSLKGTTGWPNDGNGSDSTKFNALPGGLRISIGSFLKVGEYGYWWTSTPIGGYAGNYTVLLPSINNLVNILDNSDWGYGMYVRCVKD